MSSVLEGLSHKEQKLFKDALKFFEIRQYRKGLRTCDQVLAKSPNHGETLAMKGLFLTNLDQEQEGLRIAKEGVMKSLKSYISWHVLGLVYRAGRDYGEAIKCYCKALEIDPSNMQITRDLALLLAQTRRYAELLEVRKKIVEALPNERIYKVGLAVAYHLNKQYQQAIDTIEAIFSDEGSEDLKKPGFETSELVLYRNTLYELGGQIEKAYLDLREHRHLVVDVTSLLAQRANLLHKLGLNDKAAAAYERLLERNPEDETFIESYLGCHDVSATDDASSGAAVELLDQLAARFPSSNVLKLWPLRLTSGDEFRRRADEVSRAAFRKGIPSLFNSFKTMFSECDKERIMRDLVEHMVESLKHSSRLPGSDVEEELSCRFWAEYYLVQHYDFIEEYDQALALVNGMIERSPASTELLMTKARILKHVGDFEQAKDVMDEARKLDLADRFINSKATKYLLRYGDTEKAESTIKMFVRQDVSFKLQELMDMQCIWYIYETARAHHRKNSLGLALKYYRQVEKVFNDFYDDQLDFHLYSLRKCTLRSYIKMIEWADKVFTRREFVDALLGAIECYLQLFDEMPSDKKVALASDANDSAVDKPSSPAPASRQQSNGTSGGKAAETAASAKGKGKGKGKGKKGTTSKAAVTKTIKSKGETESKKPEFERDLKGDTYIKCRNPLKEASRLINRLNPAMDTDVRVLSAAFSIYIRQGDLAGAFGAWKHIKELDISHYLVPIYSAVLAAANGQQAIDGLLKPNKLSPEQTAQLEQATASVESACARIEAVITSDGGKSSLALEAAAKAFLLLLHPEGGKERALSLIKSTVLGIQSSPYTQVKDMLRVWDLAKRIGADDEFMGQMRDHLVAVYPRSTCF